MKIVLSPCSCKNPKERIKQFAAPATYSVECSWTHGGCGKKLGDWYSKPEYAANRWNEVYIKQTLENMKG